MLKDAGATYVIVGHSERRTMHHETDALVRAKAEAALKAGLDRDRLRRRDADGARRRAGDRGGDAATPRLAAAGRRAGDRRRRLRAGLGDRHRPHPHARRTSPRCTASSATLVGEIYGARGTRVRILYGGSVKPTNARELLGLGNVDGALVGGASLKAADFLAIAAAYR